jgi:hypothetical protein
VHSAPSIVVLAVASAGLTVVLATVALLVIVSVLFLLTGGSGSAYDQIGAGGLSVEGDRAGAPQPPPAESVATPTASSPEGEREREIRQMLGARSERLVRRGQPALDVEAELARLLALASSPEGEQAPRAHDAELVAEVRALVTARNERRVRQGLEPLDVDDEVTRTLRELEP